MCFTGTLLSDCAFTDARPFQVMRTCSVGRCVQVPRRHRIMHVTATGPAMRSTLMQLQGMTPDLASVPKGTVV